MNSFLSLLALLSILFPTLLTATSLTLRIPPHIPALPPSTTAILTTTGRTLRAPITRSNSFIFNNITSADAGEYLLDIACKDYDFMSYGLDVKGEGPVMELYRVGRGGIQQGEKMRVGKEGVELRVVRAREYYEARSGCKFSPMIDYGGELVDRDKDGDGDAGMGVEETWLISGAAVSPMDLLKNPMILIAIVGLAFVFGMPYLLDNMDPEMKAEFEEQQKKSILSGGASTANPLQNFDMAAWMAGKTAGSAEQSRDEGSGSGSGSGAKARTRG